MEARRSKLKDIMFGAKEVPPPVEKQLLKAIRDLTLATNCLSFWSKLAVGAT